MAVRLKKKPARAAAVTATGPLYFYGVSPPMKGDMAKIAALGVDGDHPVEALDCAGLICWVTRVSDAFVRDLESRMDDLEWLAEASVLHQRAVSAVAMDSDLLPARFGTVFLDQDSLETHIDSIRRKMIPAFQRVSGAEEWGVKVFVTAPEAPKRTAQAAATGKDYLRLKAKALAVQNSRRTGPDAETEKLAAALKKLSRGMAPTGKVSGAQPGLQWQASFLVPRNKRNQWDTVLKRFAQRWGESRRIECTGPWPPYSFVE